MVNDVTSLTRFSTFLAEAVPEVDGLAGVDRAALERYLAWLATCGLGHGAKEDAVTGVGMFFRPSASTTGTPACRRPRCSSPGTCPVVPPGSADASPNTSWPRSRLP